MAEAQGCSRCLIVIPTYNERENIRGLVEAIRGQLPAAGIWFVDDNSPDGTGAIADEIANQDDHVRVIHRETKLGLGTAYVDAFRQALAGDYDCIVEMDADFSHDPSYLPQLIQALTTADAVIGSRYIEGGGTSNWSQSREAISRTGNWVARVGLGVRVRDATSGYRAFRRSTLERLNLEEMKLRGYGFQIEVVYQMERRGLTVAEIPIVFVERASGKSKMSKAIVLEAIGHIARRRFRDLFSFSRAHHGEKAASSDSVEVKSA